MPRRTILHSLCLFTLPCLTCAMSMAQEAGDWFAFDPKPDAFSPESGFDLRSLNERFAGENGFIVIRDGQFIHSQTGKPLRFWAVNVSPGNIKTDALKRTARILAKHGVNLVRVHGGYFKQDGSIDAARVQEAIQIVEAMKAEGIYSHLSTYFPLWLMPKPGTAWLEGYDGKTHPFAALYFNPQFQEKYRSWWEALLTTSGTTGKKLIDDPAVFGAEIINEDSYFFWTFRSEAIPDPQMQILEMQFGSWVKSKYGSIDAALSKWRDRLPRDNPVAGRVAFRPLWNMFNQRTPRDKDTSAFLTHSQREFYRRTYQFLRGLGFKGVITASNWATASPQYFGPLEKYTYTACDFLDRHGYFGCNGKGPNDAWAIMRDQSYSDRSALRFEPEKPGGRKEFVNPVMDVHYDGKPSMISETTFNRPNRFRSEAPLYYACYGALQDSNAIVHFSLDGSDWTVKPQYFMQPWSLMSPAMMGQFPAAALIYRGSLILPGDELVKLNLKIRDIENLQGTPLPQDAAFDELRARDVPAGGTIRPGQVIDPLVHFAGRTSVIFTEQGGPAKLADVRPLIDRKRQTVTSSNHQLRLDYGRGILTINAPMAQGVSGNLRDAGTTELKDLTITSDMPLGHIAVVSLDGKPLATSGRILLQVMSEEQNSDWQTQQVDAATKKIINIGHDPWLVKRPSGTVKLKRSDAAQLKLTALDFNGYPAKSLGGASEIRLIPAVIYFLITQ
jgi:hypothetical protein